MESLFPCSFKKRSYKEAMCLAKPDFRLAALFLWITLFLANRSIIDTTLGSCFSASFLSVVALSALKAFRVVLW